MKNTINLLAKVETSTFERKLRAIAKHTEALADELKLIDQEVCPLCGSGDIEITKLYGDGKVVNTKYDCKHCSAESDS